MKHYIIVKFNQEGKQRENLVQEIEALFRESADIKGVHGVSVHTSVIDLPNRYDLMICVEMERESLRLFDDSDIHLKWKAGFGQYLESKTIFDCD